jgi:hypothetical protein
MPDKGPGMANVDQVADANGRWLRWRLRSNGRLRHGVELVRRTFVNQSEADNHGCDEGLDAVLLADG